MICRILICIASLGIFVASQQYNGCYKTWTNNRVDCQQPFQIQAVSNEAACMDFCTKNQPGCKAVQYDSNSKQCGAYAIALPVYGSGRRRRRESYVPPKTYGGGYVPCSGYGPSVKYAQGYSYMQPSAQCQFVTNDPPATPPPQTPPPPTPPTVQTTTTPRVPAEATCPNGQQLRYFLVEGYQLNGQPDFTTTTSSEQACRDACTNNRLPDGTFAPCRSADYNAQTGQCLISLQAMPPTGTRDVQKNAAFKHYEKVCIDPTLGTKCPGPFFRAPQMILIGFAQAVANATSATDCLQLCANSQDRFGFVCGSAMYYYKEPNSNCILNSETRREHPDLFSSEPTDKVDYMEPGCTSSSTRVSRQASFKRNRNILRPKSSEFGGWSLCDKKYMLHRRYKQCPSMNPNKCIKDEASCEPVKEALYDVQVVPPASTTSTTKSTSTSVVTTTTRPSTTTQTTSKSTVASTLTSAPTTSTKTSTKTTSSAIPTTTQIVVEPTLSLEETSSSIPSTSSSTQTFSPNEVTDILPPDPVIIIDGENITQSVTIIVGKTSTPATKGTGNGLSWKHDFGEKTSSTSTVSTALPSWPKKQVPARVEVCEPLLNPDGSKSCQAGVKIASDGKRYLCVPSKTECS